jgi:hypothetical protein
VRQFDLHSFILGENEMRESLRFWNDLRWLRTSHDPIRGQCCDGQFNFVKGNPGESHLHKIERGYPAVKSDSWGCVNNCSEAVEITVMPSKLCSVRSGNIGIVSITVQRLSD